MQVQVNVKRIGKRRNAIETRPYEIGEVRDVGELIAAFVTAEVTRFNERASAGWLLRSSRRRSHASMRGRRSEKRHSAI